MKTWGRLRWIGLAIALCVPLAAPGAASAGTITVDTTVDSDDAGTCSLRVAISTANNDLNANGCVDVAPSDPDVVVLGGGEYHLTRTGSAEDGNASGDLDVTEGLTIRGEGPDLTGIDANGAITGERAIHLTAGALTVDGVTVHGGAATVRGGGILSIALGPTLTLRNSAISDNSGTFGGGVAGSVITLENSSVTGNRASVGSGGIDATQVDATDSIVSGNSASSGQAGGIGATTVNLTRTVVSGNVTAIDGGGVVAGGTITDSRIVRNRAAATGGGISTDIPVGGLSLTVTRSTISGNDAGGTAGGIEFTAGGTLTLTNSTLSGNTAEGSGGGLLVDEGTANVNNATIARNTADADGAGGDDGGGVFQSGTGVLSLHNTLVAENTTVGGSGPECFGQLTDPSHSAFTTSGGCTVLGTSEGVILGGSPLGGLLDNGGETPTHALLAGNLAIDAGYPGSGIGVACEATDQRGLPRGGGAGRCDIGAFEIQPPAPVGGAGTNPPLTPPVKKRCKKGFKLKKGKCRKKRR